MTRTALAFAGDDDPRPEIGAFVVYSPRSGSYTETAPAIVTEINEDATVNLTVFFSGDVGFKNDVPYGKGGHTWNFGL